MQGIELIAQERKEQIEKHGYSVKTDKEWNAYGQLVLAAEALMLKDVRDMSAETARPNGWDSKSWQKMYSKPRKERLIIAGALIAAELDRISK